MLALFIGFHFQLETPRVGRSADRRDRGGRPGICRRRGTYSGAIHIAECCVHRDVYYAVSCRRAIIIISMIRAPLLMISGVLCLGRFLYPDLLFSNGSKNSMRGDCQGYTAPLISQDYHSVTEPPPQFALERCSEIVGIGCAILADLLFSPRSIKAGVFDRELDSLLVAQYQLMQILWLHGDSEEVDNARRSGDARRRRWRGCEVI